MSKKIRSIICIALIIIISIPTVSTVFAAKNNRGPPEKIVYIHYKKGYGKPEGTPGNGPEKEDEGYYTLLVKGAKWKGSLPLTYVINPTDGPDLDLVLNAIYSSAVEWDSNTGEELFHDYSFDPDDANYFVIDYHADWDDTLEEIDDRNELVFGDYPQEGVIAVCIVWGRFGGPPSQREIFEFDIMFDTDFIWGDADELEEAVMDLQNIATHELGHGAGLGDLYNTKTSKETMHGYSSYGDIEKRDLYLGDKAGIQFLYGEPED